MEVKHVVPKEAFIDVFVLCVCCRFKICVACSTLSCRLLQPHQAAQCPCLFPACLSSPGLRPPCFTNTALQAVAVQSSARGLLAKCPQHNHTAGSAFSASIRRRASQVHSGATATSFQLPNHSYCGGASSASSSQQQVIYVYVCVIVICACFWHDSSSIFA